MTSGRRLRTSRSLSSAAVLGVLTTTAWMTAGGGIARACSCPDVSDEVAYERADVVFVGRIAEIVPMSSADAAISRWIFDVDRVFKGTAFDRQSVLTASNGASCGLELTGPGTFVVYADGGDVASASEPDRLSSDLCSGSRGVTAEAAVERFGEGISPLRGSTSVLAGGDSDSLGDRVDQQTSLIFGIVLVGAMFGLAFAGIVLGRRARRRDPDDSG